MFKVSVADFSLFDPATTSSASAYSSSPHCLTTAEYPSLGAALEALAISHCASQLPEESEERHEMIRSLRQMQNPNNSHSSCQDNTVLTKKSEREQGTNNDALLSASTTSASPASTLFPLIVDPYRVLQVRRDATPQEIRHAYRRLSLWHHPGRSIHIATATSNNNSNSNSSNGNNDNGAECAERYRRCQVFEILAACYETLLDKESRRRCDGLLRDVEMQRKQTESQCSAGVLPAGDIRVGQVKNKAAAPISPIAAATSVFQQIPTLTPVSSSGSSLEGVDLPDQEGMSMLTPQRSNHAPQQPHRDTAPAHPLQLLTTCGIGGVGGSDSSEPQLSSLMKNSTSTTTDTNSGAGADMHYSETETTRLYGGPLQLLYRSRRWKPFMDPLELFAQVFGSRAPLGILPEKDWSEWKKQAAAAAAAAATSTSITKAGGSTAAPTVTRSAAWTGSSETLPDGTVVFTTRRTLNDRVMTRTETVRTDKAGRKHSYVSVTSETVVQHDCDDAEKAKQQELASDCHVLESCMFFYKDHCTLGATNPAHANVETNSSAVFDDEFTTVETDESGADGCHALGACLVWNPAASDDDDDNRDDAGHDKQDNSVKQQQQEQDSSIFGGGCHSCEVFTYLDPEYTGTDYSSSNKAVVTSPKKDKDSRGAVDSLLDPQSWGLCGQWFPE
jgi:hypothetical protein